MVSRRAFFLSIAMLLAGQAYAAPFFVKTSSLSARSAAPLGSISTFERRIPLDIAVRAPDGIVVPFSKREEEELLRRQDNSTSSGNTTVVVDNSPPPSVPPGNLNKVNPQDVPEESPAASPNGIVQPYVNKREGSLFGRQDNSTSSGNTTVVVDNSPPPSVPPGNLNKVNPQDVPEESPAASPNGIVQPYVNKREGSLFGRQSSGNTTVVVDNSPPPSVPSGNLNKVNPQDVPEENPATSPNGIVQPYERRSISPEIPTRSLNGEIELF